MKMYVQALEVEAPSGPELQSAEGAQVGVRAPSGGTEVAAIKSEAKGRAAAWQGVVGPESRSESAPDARHK